MVATGTCLRLLASVTSIFAVDAHGRLTFPMTRKGDTGYENDPVRSHTDDQFVCRHAQPNPSVAPPTLTAGSAAQVQWDLSAAHVGDCMLYISYDVHLPLASQRYVKIANFPDCRSRNHQRVSVEIPSALPAGDAILRWDWYALHNFAGVEWYDQCADVRISSTSARRWDSFNSFRITNPPIYPANGNQEPGFHNPYGGGSFYMTGPACVDGSINQCDLTANGTRGFTGFGGEGAASPQPTPALAVPSSPPTAAPSPTPPPPSPSPATPAPTVPSTAAPAPPPTAVLQPTTPPAPVPTSVPAPAPTTSPATAQLQPTTAPSDVCVGYLPEGGRGECTACLASNNVCYIQDKSWCDQWSDYRWCGEAPPTTSAGPADVCVGYLPEGGRGECTACLASNNVCYFQEKSWCDQWSDFRWCGEEPAGEEPASLAQAFAGVGGIGLGVSAALILGFCLIHQRVCGRQLQKPQQQQQSNASICSLAPNDVCREDACVGSTATSDCGAKSPVLPKAAAQVLAGGKTAAARADAEHDPELGERPLEGLWSALKVRDVFDEGPCNDEPSRRRSPPPSRASCRNAADGKVEADGLPHLSAVI